MKRWFVLSNYRLLEMEVEPLTFNCILRQSGGGN
jgi:hypothetical protein